MKQLAKKQLVLPLILLITLLAGGCAGETQQADSGRLDALEAEVQALKAESAAREAMVRQELAQIRKNLDGIRKLIELDKARPGTSGTAQSDAEAKKDALDDDLDIKAKSFVSENLDRLLDITKKLLDKMESEIDEQMKKTEPDAPAAEGKTI